VLQHIVENANGRATRATSVAYLNILRKIYVINRKSVSIHI